MPVEQMLQQAMRAGLRGERLPNFGDRLAKELVGLINAVYDEARNWHDGTKVKARRVR